MKVKVIECESFEDFEKAVSELIGGAKDNTPTEATLVTTEEKPKKKKVKTKIPTTLDFYVKVLRKKHGLSRDHILYLLKQLWKINKTSVFNILAKQVAVTIDQIKYEDHISKSARLFCISLFNGEVEEIKTSIKNGSLFAVFRTAEDAELAREILKPLMELMF